MKILSFDIGGTKIAYALVDENGKLVTEVKTMPTPSSSAEISNNLAIITAGMSADGLAVATAGVVCQEKIIGKPYNLPEGYQNINFAKIHNKVLVENDANAAAWAEHQIGALQGKKYAVMLTLGTGVGCGIIGDNRLYYGKGGASGEVLFPIAGVDLAAYARQNGLTETDCFAIYALMQAQNPAAVKAYATWQNKLIEALIAVNQILDVEAVALSGSLAKIVDYETVQKAVNQKTFGEAVQVVPAKCENNAGLIGAALLWKDKYAK